MLINRDINAFLAKRMFGGKVLIVYGPRQAGKTTSITAFLTERGLLGESLIFNGDEPADREVLADISSERLKLLLGAKKVLFIDEAHKVLLRLLHEQLMNQFFDERYHLRIHHNEQKYDT